MDKKLLKSVDEIIAELRALDLEIFDGDSIIDLLLEVKNVAIVEVTINPGQFILRGRADKEFIKRNSEDEITYIKDTAIIPDFNRASLKGSSIFYGATTIDDESYCQMMTISEITSLHDKKYEDGNDHEEYITMGKWRVNKEIKLAAIAHHEDFHGENLKLKNLHQGFLDFIEKHPDKKDTYLKIAAFLSAEFAKPVNDNERYKYKISAAFSEIVMLHGLDGMMYPTAKDKGKGMNVALRPQAVEQCLKLEKVLVWRLIKRNKKIVLHPYLYSDKLNKKKEFLWIDPDKWISDFFKNQAL